MRFFVGKFLCYTTEKLPSGTFLGLGNFLVSKNFKHKRRTIITLFRRNCFASQYGKNVGGPSTVSKKAWVFKEVKDSRKFRGYHDFSKFFCPTVPKQFVEKPFSLVFQNLYGSKKKIRDNRGEKGRKDHHVFLSKTCLTVTKNFAGESFGVSENLGCRKTLCLRGVCHDSLEFFFSHSTEKICSWTLLCFRKLLASKNVKNVLPTMRCEPMECNFWKMSVKS